MIKSVSFFWGISFLFYVFESFVLLDKVPGSSQSTANISLT